MDETKPTNTRRATWIAGFLAASGLNFLSLSGLADSIVNWRCFLNIDVIVSTYHAFRHWIFGLVPFSVPESLQHYLIVTTSFGAMLNGYSLATNGTPYSIGYGPKRPPQSYLFLILFYLIPWIFLLWTGATLVQRSALIKRFESLQDIEELGEEYKRSMRKLSRDRRTYFAIVVLYPLVCLAALFTFSDFAYKVFDAKEIAGVPFQRSCHAEKLP
ncbi:MAG: hypothetical protein ABL956_06875 [Hyphomonadaceae bacterium]